MSKAAHKKKPSTASTPTTARPRILVTGGTPARTRSILRSLEGVNATAVTVEWEDYPEKLALGWAAMVIAEPLPTHLGAAVAAVRGSRVGKLLPLYALVDEDSSSRKARTAYRAGATAVIDWPREKKIFAGILAETLGMTKVRGTANRPDVALRRTIRAHLRLGPRPGTSIWLSTEKGVVTAAGEARSLAELEETVETIAAVPGVRQVLTSGLRVAASGIPDATVKKNIKAVMRATSDIDEKALALTVHNGRVKLRGAASSRAQFHDLLDLIAAVKGVRDLDWQITLPGKKSQSDAATVRRLRKVLLTLYPKEKIEIGVLAEVAVLSGRVRSLGRKRAVERLIARDDGVSRVVNKLVVRSS